MSWARDFGLGVVVGAAAAVLVLGGAAFAVVLRSTDLYSLGHWKLNMRTPLDTMWINLGYWYYHQTARVCNRRAVHSFVAL